jgi:hypothetical protein
MSNRRRATRTPAQVARQDQIVAAVTEWLDRRPTTLGVMLTYPDPGVVCCWCDCPDPGEPGSAHAVPGYRCPGCPDDAAWVLTMRLAGRGETRYPLCRDHVGPAWRAMVPSGVQARMAPDDLADLVRLLPRD